MKKTGDDEYEADVITLEGDDGETLDMVILAKFQVVGRLHKEYAALVPLDEFQKDDFDSVYLYEYSEEGDDVTITEIEDDDEFREVSDRFDEIADEEDFCNLY